MNTEISIFSSPAIIENPRKRKQKEEINDHSKRKRINPIELTDLPDKARVEILGQLCLKDFLAFDSTAKLSRNLTNERWKELLIAKRFDFNWSDLILDLHSNKSQYILGNAICNYVKECEKELKKSPNNPKLQRIYEQFKERMLRFPLFGAYVWKDLNLLRKLKNIREDLMLGSKTDPLKFENDFDLQKLEEGGDLLLKGLFRYRLLVELIQKKVGRQSLLPDEIEAFKNAHKTLSDAIQKNATCASFLAVIVSDYKSNNIQFSFARHFFTLGTEAVGKNKDHRGLDETLNRYSQFFNFSDDMGFPSIMAFKAKFDINITNEEKEDLFSEAISEYGKNVPGWVLAGAAYIKFLLCKNNEAAQLYNQAFKDPMYEPNYIEFHLAAFINFLLEKYDEAECFYDQALKDPMFSPDPENLIFIATLKIKSNKSEAKSFYEKALKSPDFNFSPKALCLAEKIKVELETQ